MNPLLTISIMDRRAQPVPYRGPLRKSRRPLKWVILIALAAYIAYFAAHGFQVSLLTPAAGLAGALLIAGVALLFATRTKYEMVPKRLTVHFYPSHLVWERETDRVGYGREQKRVDKIPYASIEKMRFQTLYGRIEIFGLVHCEIFRRDKDGAMRQHPSYKKTAKAAVSARVVWVEGSKRLPGRPVTRPPEAAQWTAWTAQAESAPSSVKGVETPAWGLPA